MARRKKSSFRRRAKTFVRSARRSFRSAKKTARRVGRSTARGYLPMNVKDSLVTFGTGAVLPKVNEFVAPYTDGMLSFAGEYKDEVRTAIIGIAAHKLGSGLVKDMGREAYRAALLSAGNETGRRFLGGSGNASNGGYL